MFVKKACHRGICVTCVTSTKWNLEPTMRSFAEVRQMQNCRTRTSSLSSAWMCGSLKSEYYSKGAKVRLSEFFSFHFYCFELSQTRTHLLSSRSAVINRHRRCTKPFFRASKWSNYDLPFLSDHPKIPLLWIKIILELCIQGSGDRAGIMVFKLHR